MKKVIVKLTAFLLCCVMLFAGVSPCFAAALPEGTAASDVLDAIPKTEKLVSSLLSQNEATADLDKSVYGALFSDDTLNGILKGVYGALSENESTFTTLGLDISVAAVAAQLEVYPEVYEYLSSKQSWSEVFSGRMDCKWGIKSKSGFSHALAGMLAPLNPLLYTLLCGGRYKVSALIYVDGDMGYQNAVVPMLRALNCPAVMSQEDFSARAKQNPYMMVRNILDMLYSTVDYILEAPVDRLCTVLPCIAYFMQNGGVTEALDTLIAPMKVQVGLFQLSGLDKILESTGMLSDAGSLTDLLENIDLSALTGTDMDLQLPELDLNALAACCTYSNGTYVSDKASAFCEILRWALRLFRANKTKLLASFGGAGGASGFADTLLAKSDDELIKLLLEILNMNADDVILEYAWTYPDYVPGSVTYTPNLTEAEYSKVLNEIDDTLNEFMSEFGDGSLTSTLSTTIYSNKLVTTLVKTLYGALYSDDTSALLGMVGLDASTSGIAKKISSSYPSAARSISAALKWENVNENTVSWGFYNGDGKGFRKALTAVLRPLIPFLDVLLAEGSLDLLGAIKVKGSNGYNTAVIPILEGLGCKDIKAYAQYKTARGTDEALTFILDPVCNLLDDLIEKPVATLCEKLPNIIYFVNSGSIKQCVDNLMYPVKVLLEKFGMSSLMPQELASLGDIDLSALLTQLSEGGTLPFKLPALDLNQIASLGTAEKYDSKRTYNGLFTSYTAIRADGPAVLVTLLRYFIGALADPANGDGLSSLMGGDAMEGNDMFAMYAGNITEQFKTMSVDEIIEWLYNLLFRETPKKEIEEKDEYIPTIIYQPEPDHTARNRAILITAAILLPTLLVVYLSKRDVNAAKERRQRKKQKKQAAKEAVKKNKTAVARDAATRNAELKKAAKAKQAALSAEKETLPAKDASGGIAFASRTRRPDIPEDDLSLQIDRAESIEAGNLHEKIEKDRELAKLRVRQEKAVKKALREAKKADKYYEQALKEAEKRK